MHVKLSQMDSDNAPPIPKPRLKKAAKAPPRPAPPIFLVPAAAPRHKKTLSQGNIIDVTFDEYQQGGSEPCSLVGNYQLPDVTRVMVLEPRQESLNACEWSELINGPEDQLFVSEWALLKQKEQESEEVLEVTHQPDEGRYIIRSTPSPQPSDASIEFFQIRRSRPTTPQPQMHSNYWDNFSIDSGHIGLSPVPISPLSDCHINSCHNGLSPAAASPVNDCNKSCHSEFSPVAVSPGYGCNKVSSAVSESLEMSHPASDLSVQIVNSCGDVDTISQVFHLDSSPSPIHSEIYHPSSITCADSFGDNSPTTVPTLPTVSPMPSDSCKIGVPTSCVKLPNHCGTAQPLVLNNLKPAGTFEEPTDKQAVCVEDDPRVASNQEINDTKEGKGIFSEESKPGVGNEEQGSFDPVAQSACISPARPCCNAGSHSEEVQIAVTGSHDISKCHSDEESHNGPSEPLELESPSLTPIPMENGELSVEESDVNLKEKESFDDKRVMTPSVEKSDRLSSYVISNPPPLSPPPVPTKNPLTGKLSPNFTIEPDVSGNRMDSLLPHSMDTTSFQPDNDKVPENTAFVGQEVNHFTEINVSHTVTGQEGVAKQSLILPEYVEIADALRISEVSKSNAPVKQELSRDQTNANQCVNISEITVLKQSRSFVTNADIVEIRAELKCNSSKITNTATLEEEQLNDRSSYAKNLGNEKKQVPNSLSEVDGKQKEDELMVPEIVKSDTKLNQCVREYEILPPKQDLSEDGQNVEVRVSQNVKYPAVTVEQLEQPLPLAGRDEIVDRAVELVSVKGQVSSETFQTASAVNIDSAPSTLRPETEDVKKNVIQETSPQEFKPKLPICTSNLMGPKPYCVFLENYLHRQQLPQPLRPITASYVINTNDGLKLDNNSHSATQTNIESLGTTSADSAIRHLSPTPPFVQSPEPFQSQQIPKILSDVKITTTAINDSDPNATVPSLSPEPSASMQDQGTLREMAESNSDRYHELEESFFPHLRGCHLSSETMTQAPLPEEELPDVTVIQNQRGESSSPRNFHTSQASPVSKVSSNSPRGQQQRDGSPSFHLVVDDNITQHQVSCPESFVEQNLMKRALLSSPENVVQKSHENFNIPRDYVKSPQNPRVIENSREPLESSTSRIFHKTEENQNIDTDVPPENTSDFEKNGVNVLDASCFRLQSSTEEKKNDETKAFCGAPSKESNEVGQSNVSAEVRTFEICNNTQGEGIGEVLTLPEVSSNLQADPPQHDVSTRKLVSQSRALSPLLALKPIRCSGLLRPGSLIASTVSKFETYEQEEEAVFPSKNVAHRSSFNITIEVKPCTKSQFHSQAEGMTTEGYLDPSDLWLSNLSKSNYKVEPKESPIHEVESIPEAFGQVWTDESDKWLKRMYKSDLSEPPVTDDWSGPKKVKKVRFLEAVEHIPHFDRVVEEIPCEVSATVTNEEKHHPHFGEPRTEEVEDAQVSAPLAVSSSSPSLTNKADKELCSEEGDIGNGIPFGHCEETLALVAASCLEEDEATNCILLNAPMGSNVSRHSGKALNGRHTRSISTDNLCHGAKLLAPTMGKLFHPCGGGNRGVDPRERYKLGSSLPNHLNDKESAAGRETFEGDRSPESEYGTINNYGEVYGLDLTLSKLASDGTIGGDQGYSSEKSSLRTPEEDTGSSIPLRFNAGVFEVDVEKGSQGLGLSLSGGEGTDEPLHIKTVYPHSPAWKCGLLQPGDVLLQVDDIPLTGLTRDEALVELRSTAQTTLRLVLQRPDGTTPFTPMNLPHSAHQQVDLDFSHILQLNMEPSGEFDITMKKVKGSLGFTLRKEDESVLGHYVRALVREPALSDGRIRPGDKIVAVNGVDISPLTHEEAVQMLRNCGTTVVLRLYRDSAQTPVSALSPTESYPLQTRRPTLRQEAVDLLSDLAVRRRSPGTCTSPRRRRLERSDPTRASDVSRPNRPTVLNLEQRHPFDLVSVSDEPASLPTLSSPHTFSTQNPLYQSGHLPHTPIQPQDETDSSPLFQEDAGSHGLLKWKGVMFTPEESPQTPTVGSTPTPNLCHSGLSQRTDGEVLTVELSKGWNSRLGFSLMEGQDGTYISTIYPDSVAAKDGRLHEGDKVIMINDERISGMNTNEVIHHLRKIRGPIAITVIRVT